MKTTRTHVRSAFPQRTLALVAVGFGCVTIIAGGRVLGGADPGYVVCAANALVVMPVEQPPAFRAVLARFLDHRV